MVRQAVVVLTGASKGIGLATAEALLTKFNARVVALSRSITPELQALIDAYPHSLTFLQCDIADDKRLAEVISIARDKYQNIDALILNAAVLEPVSRIENPQHGVNAWRTHFDVNFFSLVTAVQESLRDLRASELGGRIIFVSSGAAVGGIPGWGPYNAGKAAMNSLCRTLAQEEPSIVSVAVRPGMVDTPMQTQLREIGGPHMTQMDHNKFMRIHADGKLIKPEQTGHLLAALSLGAPKSISGKFVSWESDECKEFRMQS